MKNLVSIITVVYNDWEGLKKTIQSVISQTYKNIEYIIVDGGSTDETVDVIKKYQDKISTWVSELDKGIYDAMNKGIRMATGEWLIFMNAGDVLADSYVIQNIFSKNIPDNISFLYSDIYCLRSNGDRVLRRMDFNSGTLIHQSIIYRRNLHKEHGFYVVTDSIIISDALFFARIPKSEVMKVKTVISVYEGGGVSQQGNWAEQQLFCLDVVFRRRTFWSMISAYLWKRVKSLVSVETKDKLKVIFNINYKPS